MNSKQKNSTITTVCIVVSYIVLYGIFSLFVYGNDSTTVFLIFLVFCMAFAYKSCKGFLVNTLSSLPWPVFLVLTILIAGVVGAFTAPYHIGKWIAKKIAPMFNSNQIVNTTYENTASKKNEFDNMMQKINTMSESELDHIHDELLEYVMKRPIPLPGVDFNLDEFKKKEKEFDNKLLAEGKLIYGCRTYGEATRLNEAIVQRIDQLYKKR